MRAFFGVAADAATVQAVRRLRAAVDAPLHWVADGNLHLTLLFLGDTDAAGLPALQQAVQPLAAQPPFVLQWATLAWFPSVAHARVLALLPAPSPALLAWQAALDAAVRAHGLQPDTRPYRPHLSLARVRRAEAVLPAALPGLPQAMPVQALTLFRSDSGPQGVRYTPCFTLPLAPGG